MFYSCWCVQWDLLVEEEMTSQVVLPDTSTLSLSIPLRMRPCQKSLPQSPTGTSPKAMTVALPDLGR